MSGFEGHMNKEASTGKSIFHPKHSVQKVTTNTQLPPGHPPFAKKGRPESATTRAFLKSIGD